MVVSLQSGVARPALLELLSDGRLHSGALLAREMGVSTGAVESEIERLRVLGVEINTLPRRGYRLPHAVELFDARLIRDALGADRQWRLRNLEVLLEVDSTNTRLLEFPSPPEGQADVCICELQHSGRGRRGRRWIAPFGDSIALSLGWTFRDAARASPALSLAVGVAVEQALRRAGARGIRLKWPNDVWLDGRKVGGILLELRADASGPAHVVIGVGLNLSLTGAARCEIERSGVRAAAVADACPRATPRNRMAGILLDELLRMLEQFQQEGFAAFFDAWMALDALRGRPAQVLATAGAMITGTACGVDADGALLLEIEGHMQRFVSGEVSLRPTQGEA
jgi:BirA family transcriptional regulator, biotin operon repressor / biotin---[acetyl-CoA-carboxylase] ligase